eukprot:85964-Pyramimonas_sp.AAC.1
MGLVDSMGRCMLGAYWAKLQWVAIAMVVVVVGTVLGSTVGVVLWFVGTAWRCSTLLFSTTRGFAQGSKSGHDAKLALDGNTAAALTWHG